MAKGHPCNSGRTVCEHYINAIESAVQRDHRFFFRISKKKSDSELPVDEGANALEAAMGNNTVLEILKLDGNRIHGQLQRSISHALRLRDAGALCLFVGREIQSLF